MGHTGSAVRVFETPVLIMAGDDKVVGDDPKKRPRCGETFQLKGLAQIKGRDTRSCDSHFIIVFREQFILQAKLIISLNEYNL